MSRIKIMFNPLNGFDFINDPDSEIDGGDPDTVYKLDEFIDGGDVNGN